ncbi:MAG: sugar transferase [Ignavibacterium sp.]|nr:sugar transferase [Ignavibacterium sp.]MDW8374572.1 sugar transferase [Ignavibacteriales bacterium]
MKIEKFKIKLLISDLILLMFSFYSATYFQSLIKGKHLSYSFDEILIETIYFLIVSSVILLIFQFNNLYKLHIFISKVNQFLGILKSLFYGVTFLIVLSFLLKFSIVLDSRIFVLLFSLISLFLITFARIFILRPVFLQRRTLYNRRILIVGSQKNALMIASKFLLDNDLGVKIIGYVVEQNHKVNSDLFKDIKYLGGIEDLDEIIYKNNVDEIIISIDQADPSKIISLIDKCNNYGVSVKIISDLFKVVGEKIEIENFYGLKLINSTPRINRNTSIIFKRIFDFVFSLLGLIILSPFLIIISLLIKITSKGPIIYKQIRIGKNGKPFEFYKFRSMTVIEGEEDELRKKMMIDFMKNGNHKIKGTNKVINESRVTKVGKFLRKYSLDELPQLINVLKGDMSLVGPRPCLPYEYENYDEWQKRRLDVYPGCTGVWQVYGRGKVSFIDSVILDLFYVNNMSPWLDLSLILKTIPVIIYGKGGK